MGLLFGLFLFGCWCVVDCFFCHVGYVGLCLGVGGVGVGDVGLALWFT